MAADATHIIIIHSIFRLQMNVKLPDFQEISCTKQRLFLYFFQATTEQEQFAKGFDEALLSMREKDNINKMNNNNNNKSINNNPATTIAAISAISTATTTTHNTMSGGDITYTDLGK